MKKIYVQLVLLTASFGLLAAEPAQNSQHPVKIGLVNFKLCVEESKMGRQEEASFETMKKQMENVVAEKEKILTELANKLNDPDQLDLMSPETETELKENFDL